MNRLLNNSFKSIAFIDSYHKGLYGAPRSMLSLASGLINFFSIVDIITTKEGNLSNKAKEMGLNANVFSCPDILLESRKGFTRLKLICYVFNLISFWVNLAFKYSLKKYDLICVNDIRTFLIFLPILIVNRKKIIWYVRINDRVGFIYRVAVRLSRLIILISKDCINSFSDAEKINFSSKFCVVHTGFEQVNSTRDSFGHLILNHKQDDKVFITVGSICKRKNQISIVRSFSNIPSHKKHLYIVGSPANESDNDYYNELLDMIEQLNISNFITFIPHTPYVFDYLSNADIFLFASHAEGLPRVVIEALMMGCFVISSKVDGVSDIIVDDKLGIITKSKPSDPIFIEEYTQLLTKYFCENHDRTLGVSFVKNNFSYENYISRFVVEVKKGFDL